MISIEYALAVGGVLLLVAIGASKASSRLGVPSLLVFLLIGMLAGEEGPGGIPFDDAKVAQWLGSAALAIILFAGGLDTDAGAIRGLLWRGLSLSTLGVVITAVITGLSATYFVGLSPLEGMLLGAIVSSTDAAAVFAVLRSQSIGLKGRVKPLLELESGSNDPMAVFLTVATIRLLTDANAGIGGLVLSFFIQMPVGAAAGIAVGRLSVWLLNRINLETEGLYPALTLALALLSYGGTSLVGGNGFLAAYLAGIVLSSRDFIHKKSLLRFHDGLAWLMQLVMFLVLGLLVYPSRLVPVAAPALMITLVLMLVARPAGVFIALATTRLPVRAKLLISWVGLRGAVPIVLATFPLLAGVPNSEVYFNVVFFIVLTSVLLQGTTLATVARWLHMATPLPPQRRAPIEFVPTQRTHSELVEIEVPANSPASGVQIVDLRLPRSALIVLITRADQYVVPRGATAIQPGDVLLLLVDRSVIAEIHQRFGIEGSEPAGA